MVGCASMVYSSGAIPSKCSSLLGLIVAKEQGVLFFLYLLQRCENLKGSGLVV